jgi:microsomal dipeptidase-like Zn-dependent dipeptidase
MESTNDKPTIEEAEKHVHYCLNRFLSTKSIREDLITGYCLTKSQANDLIKRIKRDYKETQSTKVMIQNVNRIIDSW